MLNIRQIETFYWVAKLRSFTAAAERMGATQSAISVRIRELEVYLGFELFDRGHRTPKVTTKGRQLIVYAERILKLCLEAEHKLSEAVVAPDVIRLGFAEVISITWLPQLVSAIHMSYPNTRLELHEALAQELFDELKRGTLDLVLGAGMPRDQRVHAVPLGKVKFEWMASPSLELPQRPMDPKELQNWPVIALARESVHYKTIEDWFATAGGGIHRFDTCKSINVASSLAIAGFGVTILPLCCYQTEIADGRLLVVPTKPKLPDLEFNAISASDNLDPAVREVAKLAGNTSSFKTTIECSSG